MITKTWTAKDIERAVEQARRDTACPQCEMASVVQVIARVAPWRLAVGVRDVTVTTPVVCSRAGHRFLLIVSLWSPAKTPSAGIKFKKKIGHSVLAPPRPLAGI